MTEWWLGHLWPPTRSVYMQCNCAWTSLLSHRTPALSSLCSRTSVPKCSQAQHLSHEYRLLILSQLLFEPILQWVLWYTATRLVFIMPSPPDSVDEGIMFSGCPSAAFVRSFVRTDLVTMISHEWHEQSRWNLQEIFTTDDLIRFWRSKVKVTAGRRGCEGIHGK